ncbi:Putative ribonuclease H protein At1g65750 [Linum perenne]
MITRNTYQPILDRLDAKLSGWKANSLSLVGRVILTFSILNAIPAYAMQTSVLPCHICESIDRKIRNFVWGSINDCMKIHLMSWTRFVSRRNMAGCGLRRLRNLIRPS